MHPRWLSLFVLSLLCAPLSAQQVERPEPGPVFRLSVTLAQVDAVVTDRKGRHVTTLGPADFQVFQDGRLQPVTAVAYIRGGRAVPRSGRRARNPSQCRRARATRAA